MLAGAERARARLAADRNEASLVELVRRHAVVAQRSAQVSASDQAASGFTLRSGPSVAGVRAIELEVRDLACASGSDRGAGR